MQIQSTLFLCSLLGLAALAVAADGPPTEFDVAALPERTEQELAQGWIWLFDGQSTFGWKTAGEPTWKIDREERTLVSVGDAGYLRTTSQWGDFRLRLDYQTREAKEVAVLVRAAVPPRNPAADAYVVTLTGVGKWRAGDLVGRALAKNLQPHLFADNVWQQLEIVARGDVVRVIANGRQLLEYQDPRPLGRGFIALRTSGGGARFRNIRLQPLGLNEQIDGKLSGWKPAGESKFAVNESGFLTVRGGKGQLETTAHYGDFVLQSEAITHAAGLNSGIFFRCIPGDMLNGYECQIHNGFREHRTQPVDCGSGGIFRRQCARAVLGDDERWLYQTIVANGPHLATWTNGIQVVDWTDRREPNDNPRQGLRTKPGAIILQGHDPTTDLSFRSIRVRETPPRWQE